ncbi:elongation factor P 5-aminopentanone reductase [Virgibacillus siamensis]|uniref:elongation factor P 5-aminopentanone reductase n=1 Tax=Virgibacillus siamensis TaxID=480071 RepID=UPI000986342B|nr:SDR family oxidoreductase [Virgibacillus siamensis]
MGKNVLLIGSSGDIGSAIAKNLAADGYRLLLHYHKNEEAVEKLKNNLPDESVLSCIQADLRNQDGIEKLLRKMVYTIDAIIFASGKASIGLFQDVTESLMDDMIALHVKAPWLICNSLLPDMIRKKEGNIIFITSIWGNIGASNEVIYSSVKGAQNSFVKALAKEVALSGVFVNAVSPGFIDTKMNQQLLPEEKELIRNEIPANRAGTPEEVANAVRFLISEQSSYIQGEILNVTGGWS